MPVAADSCCDGGPGPQRLLDDAQPAVVRQSRPATQRRRRPRPSARPGEHAAGRSSERSAFCSASVKLRPIAIASPTDFIVVVRVGSARGNFSKANRGTFTTT